jgi:diguanylate cyclase
MASFRYSQFEQKWAELLALPRARLVQQLASANPAWLDALAGHFCATVLGDELLAQLDADEAARAAVDAALRQWAGCAFETPADGAADLVNRQQEVTGQLARMRVPAYLLLRGVNALKEKFGQELGAQTQLPRLEQLELQLALHEVFDLTVEIMGVAYVTLHNRDKRAGEAYRLAVVVQNLDTQRQRQRAALLDWERRIMFELAAGTAADQLPAIGASEFGQWFRTEGARLFRGMEEAALLRVSLKSIDSHLLPEIARLGAAGELAARVELLRKLRDEVQAIAEGVDALLRRESGLEAGLDARSRLLNRQYLPAVLNKEVTQARQQGSTFAVLAVDVDGLAGIAASHGAAAGNWVLEQLAAALSNKCRAGDYIFRLEDDKFFMVLADIEQPDAAKVAESVRAAVAQTDFSLPDGGVMQLTVSIGLTMYSGRA